MINFYFKQAWEILKQNRFYSTIYVLATGFSISMIMVLAIVLYIKTANVYPETGRDRMLIMNYGEAKNKDGDTGLSRLSFETIQKCIYSLQTAEAVSAVYNVWPDISIQPDNSAEQIPAKAKYVDTGFWKVFSFLFVDGKPFTEADMQSGIKTVVISESFARQLFGTTEATGKQISISFNSYRICGVVKDVSYIADKTYAQCWIPYTALPSLTAAWQQEMYENTLGSFTGYALASSKSEVNTVRGEILSNVNRYTSSLKYVTLNLFGQPDSHLLSLFRLSNRQDINITKIFLQYFLLILVILLIPAIGLSGMTDSQMDKRLSEIGIRRSFGATRKSVIKQLITENLLLTFLGGITGLLFSYLFVYSFRKWIIHIGTGQVFANAVPQGVDVALSPSMFMNYTVFGFSLLICLILNIMITVFPAWHASRQQIVYSINTKK